MAAAFEQVIRLQVQKYASPEAVRRHHIAVARKGLAAFMARQQERPGYTIETDHRPATSEESVQPFGIIAYRFTRMREVAAFALAEAMRLSPVLSGEYRKSWFAMVDGREAPLTAIGGAREVMITNDRPWSRKVNVGAKGFEKYARPGIVEKVKELVKRRYGRIVEAQVVYITLGGGYRLKRSARRRRRRATQAGSELTYPTVKITVRF